MSSLQSLIDKYGYPDAILDHWNDPSSQLGIWGFESVFEHNHHGVLIDGKLVDRDSLNSWQEWVNNCKQDDQNISAIGFISYEYKQFLFSHIPFKKYDSDLPFMWFAKPKQIHAFSKDFNSQPNPIPSLELVKDIPDFSQYEKDISRIKYYLEHGDVYQINYTHPKIFKHNSHPCELYLQIREMAQPKHGVFINTGVHQVLSFSPERFFKIKDGIIESYPMKGTRPRFNDMVLDKQSAVELAQSKKDKAEHLMIVDLLRNDIGKVCKYGSVSVDDLYQIESFETVHQMVSSVHGKCDPKTTESDIVKALFPGGSITGAPKERAMAIIDELETTPRGVYTGGIGTIKSNGDMDFNIAIRTMTIKNNFATYPVGGGIVWDSDPKSEWEEAHTKGAILHPFIKHRELENA